MSSHYLTVRATQHGKRYVVRFRLGGRDYPVKHAGSFTTMKEATKRRELVAGELAVGRNPLETIAAMLEPVEAPKVKTLNEWAVEYRASRMDAAAETVKNMGSHLKAILPTFGEQDPFTITFQEVQGWVAALADPGRKPRPLEPSSMKRYMATFRLLLEYAGVDPNPARDKRVNLPTVVTEEPDPPTAKQFLAILDKSPRRWVLPLIVMEQTAMRVGEVQSLAWGDADVAEKKFRLRSGETKTRRARWVQVPEWLMELIEETCPLEDRTADRVVFQGFSPDVAKNVMARACVAAGVPHFHPHDLRHRRLSLWHGQGVPPKELATRAGHSRASMTLDVYSHVMPLDECAESSLRAAIVP
jgi:integrase